MRATLSEWRSLWVLRNVIPLQPEDVAAAIAYAVTQSSHVNVNEILIRPLKQEF